jgi:hypothetical protein
MSTKAGFLACAKTGLARSLLSVTAAVFQACSLSECKTAGLGCETDEYPNVPVVPCLPDFVDPGNRPICFKYLSDPSEILHTFLSRIAVMYSAFLCTLLLQGEYLVQHGLIEPPFLILLPDKQAIHVPGEHLRLLVDLPHSPTVVTWG